MSTASASELQEALRLGLSVVSELWNYKAKNWVTSIAAADIDNDGDTEVIAGSRDGRVSVLTAAGDCIWTRIVGEKAWVGAVVGISAHTARGQMRVLAGTRDGRVYAFDKSGRTLSKDGKSYSFDKQGRANEQEKEQAACWLQGEQVIRQVTLDSPTHPGQIIIASEDRRIYSLDYRTGAELWSYQTGGRVRALYCHDLNGDGAVEIIVGSADKHLYILDAHGNCVQSCDLGYQIYTIFASDVDHNEQVEILLGTDAKTLVALTPSLVEKWHRPFENRLLSLYVADVDNDGQHEIIAGSEDQHLYILDQQGKLLWRHHLGHRIFSVYAGDIDNDGLVEVLLGADDQRIHALHIRPLRNLDKKIHRGYDALVRAGQPPPPNLSTAERALLEDILREAGKQKRPIEQRHIMQQIEALLAASHFRLALPLLLQLALQKVDLLWPKDKIRYVRALQFGDISGDAKQEIIMGTAEGKLLAFNHLGRQLWSTEIGAQILDLQAGYIDHGKWEEIIVCATDHHIYVIDGDKNQIKRKVHVSDWLSSIYVTAPGNDKLNEIIVGTEDKQLILYRDNLLAPAKTIPTPQGIGIVCSRDTSEQPGEEAVPEIIAGSIGDEVYAYTRAGVLLWHYQTKDSIRAVTLRDLDNDGEYEVIIGSEDRNVHVLDSYGHLKWRYYTPHRILTVDTADIDHDGKLEVLAGCGDGILYVLNHKGDLLWKYQANDRIRVVRAEDIDGDGKVEIAVATEDQLELLRVVDQRHIQQLINHCWDALMAQQPVPDLIETLLTDANPLMRAFALHKYAELCIQTPGDVTRLLDYTKDHALEVRKALIPATLRCYTIDTASAQRVLSQLSTDQEPEVRMTLVESLDQLVAYDQDVGFDYLDGFLHNLDRFVRRAVIRELAQLLDVPGASVAKEKMRDSIFELLNVAIMDDESDWIRREAARTLARFLDVYPQNLISSLYACIVSGITISTLKQVGHNTTNNIARHIIEALILLMRKDLDTNNILSRVEQAVAALEEIKFFSLGKDAWLLYDELRTLLTLHTLDEIASYQCQLTAEQFTPDNLHFPIVLRIIERLDSVTRMLAIYARRSSPRDRMASLLDTLAAIDEMGRFIDREYTQAPGEEPLQRLPDHRIFVLLLKQWSTLVTEQLNALRGKAELRGDLSTKSTWGEKQVGFWLNISNRGYSNANNVKVTLLHSDEYTIIGPGSFESELLAAQQETAAEFTIQPTLKTSLLKLSFEIAYEDASDGLLSCVKTQLVDANLELQMMPTAFHHIPNPYSTGTPSHDAQMFYGRKAETAFLQDNLTRPLSKTVIVLYGQRRSGKTSLLLHLAELSVLEPHIALFIDMQNISSDFSFSKFLQRVAYQLSRDLRKRGIILPLPPQNDFERDPTFTFDMYLDEVEEHSHGQKIILMLDEFEVLEKQIKHKTVGPEIFEYLRSLMQHRRDLNFLLAGTHKIEQLTTSYWSVFFNIALHYQLSKLNPQDASDLIEKPVQEHLQYGPDTLHKIRGLTGDQPYLIHMVCRALVDYCNERRKSYVTLNDINAVQRDVMQTGQVHFGWLWEHITLDERIALSALAHGGKDERRALSLYEIEEIYRHYHYKTRRDHLVASLKQLIEADIIEREQDDAQDQDAADAHYKIAIGLLRRWLRKEQPLEQVMRDAREQS